tara:strand:+ start:1371 stop:1520 length:150 start_codon:yes stop_codon:yes gene_type:complete
MNTDKIMEQGVHTLRVDLLNALIALDKLAVDKSLPHTEKRVKKLLKKYK